MPEEKTLRVDHDSDPLALMEAVNRALRECAANVSFERVGNARGFTLYRIVRPHGSRRFEAGREMPYEG